MFGELRSVEIIVNERNIQRNDVFEKGKIDKRIQSLIVYLRKQNLDFGYVSEGRNNFITLNGDKVAIIRTYSSNSNSNSVGFSISAETIRNYPVVALSFEVNDNSIDKIYFVPKGTKKILKSGTGKTSKNNLEENNCTCINIVDLCDKLTKGGAVDETGL